MRVYKTKWFARFQRRERISDESLCEAIERARQGLIDADLGGGVVKQRVARKGQGRSGGYRTLMAWRKGDRAVFVYGFAKSERDNIDSADLATLKEIAAMWLTADEARIERALESNDVLEVPCGKAKEEA